MCTSRTSITVVLASVPSTTAATKPALYPSPSRLAEIKKRVVDEAVQCVLAEPQYKAGLVAAVVEGTDAKTTVIDPLGAKLEPGVSLYDDLIRNLATNLAKCF